MVKNMISLDDVISKINKFNMSLDKILKVKIYLPTIEKFNFLDEYKKMVKEHESDYPDYAEYVALVFFNLMIVKKYTNIEFDMTYESFDKMQQNKIIGYVVGCMEEDYELLLNLVKLNR